MKKNNVISNVLIVLGLLVIFTSLSLKIYYKNKEKTLMNKFDNELKVHSKKNKRFTNKNNKKSIQRGKEIASINIPSIGLQSIIVEGIEDEQLKYSLGHFEKTAMAGENGNFSIAGHSSHIYNEIFNNLYKVNIGDKINIKTMDGNFQYIIKQKFVVRPTATAVLNQDFNKKSMTIVTCIDGGKNRLIVKAEINV